MSRVVDVQVNPWGRWLGPEPQRSDLWIVDFSYVLTMLGKNAKNSAMQGNPDNGVPYTPPEWATYLAQSVTLPELKVAMEPIRRDSRPYPTPAWDQPLDAISMNFILDASAKGSAAPNPYRSDVYQMLDLWRASVRAGRGSMSSEYCLTLNSNYQLNYKSIVRVLLLRGGTPFPPPNGPSAADIVGLYANGLTPGAINNMLVSMNGDVAQASGSPDPQNDLQFAMQYDLVNCWLSGFKLSELSYEQSKVLTLQATFYADDIQQESITSLATTP
jgi:hypothetical protein